MNARTPCPMKGRFTVQHEDSEGNLKANLPFPQRRRR
jgi:hypothetical protein